ncbi:unnamed protein product [Coffea canephora]|uniref:Uncharacterized protein n=2 Tax=Coffea TaxID=13442 RepID=A0A068VHR6_COFCA|nr:uncharacterized protein LOC113735527 [Coffea arabica]CDP20380.1 unnamed protein product [Coffea canephora]
MGSEANSSSSASSAAVAAAGSPSGKRSRDPEDEVYLDNLHSHKRYLSEIMASSLNGLTVGDHLPYNIMDSPARSESIFYLRDEMSLEYSPMSEDSDDSRYYETSINTCSAQPESRPTSPVSPYRNQRQLIGVSSGLPTTSYAAHSCPSAPATSSQSRQRGSDSEGRFPSSPSDICHSADLRRAALLRSVQMRTQPLGSSSFDPPSSSVQEPGHNMETEDRPCSYMKSLVDDTGYQIEECSPLTIEPKNQEKSCATFNTNLRRDDPGE